MRLAAYPPQQRLTEERYMKKRPVEKRDRERQREERPAFRGGHGKVKPRLWMYVENEEIPEKPPPFDIGVPTF